MGDWRTRPKIAIVASLREDTTATSVFKAPWPLETRSRFGPVRKRLRRSHLSPRVDYIGKRIRKQPVIAHLKRSRPLPARKKTSEEARPSAPVTRRKKAADKGTAVAKTPRRKKTVAAGTASSAPRGKNLVIVESTAKAKTIQKSLGPGFEVLASYGHVRDLPRRKRAGEDIAGVKIAAGWIPTYVVEDREDKRGG